MTGFLGNSLRWVRRCAIALLGGAVLLVGICMIVLPGPAILVIPAGLAILSLEFSWARLLLRRVRARGGQAAHYIRSQFEKRDRSGDGTGQDR